MLYSSNMMDICVGLKKKILQTAQLFKRYMLYCICCYIVHSAAEVSITLSDLRPVERGFFIACGGTSSFLEERCQLKWTIHFQKHILIDCFTVFSS